MEAMNTPLVSVLIPVYNHERFLPRCLDSVLEDDYPAKEIIVIDDGSTDGSAAALRSWHAANRGRLEGRFEFLSRPNKGVTKTFNELVSLARGEFIILLASDDHLLPGGIRARLDYLRRHDEKLAVFADCVVIDDEGRKLHDSGIEGLYPGRKRYLLRDELLPFEFAFFWCVPGPVFMARRSTYEIIGKYDETLAVEDWDFFLRLAARNAVGFLDYPVAAYRIHGGNSINSASARFSGHLESMLRTAWQNKSLFRGVVRYRLMAKAFDIKTELLKLRGCKGFKVWLYFKAARRLNSVTMKLYKKRLAKYV